MKVAVVGATGLVGSKMLESLAKRNFPVTELLPVASPNSIGKQVSFKGTDYPVITLETALEKVPDVAIFSAGSSISLEWAPKFAEKNCYVIDNSSAWRMHPDIKLIIPEINGDSLLLGDYIIANPNCSTIQMLLPLYPIHKKYGITRIVVSTYQSVSGSGQKALNQLLNERAGEDEEMVYPYPIDLNVLPHIDSFLEDGYTKEERKMMDETIKIMADDTIKVSATTVRVPVIGGHSESVNVSLLQDFEIDDIRSSMAEQSGVTIEDDPAKNIYPMPRYAQDKEDVFVGRIRRDLSAPYSFNCWIVADNLLKGAATNAVQIAEVLLRKNLLPSG